jgi:hypothetical protein
VAQTAENVPEPLVEDAEEASQSAANADFMQSNPVEAITDPRPLDEAASAELPSESAASQPAATNEANDESPLLRRIHGGALPR